MVPAGDKAKHLPLVNHITNTIHHHHNNPFTEADMARRCDYELKQLRITIDCQNTTLVLWEFAVAIKHLSKQQFNRF